MDADKLTEDEKNCIPNLNGRQVYEQVSILLKTKKINKIKSREMLALWLNKKKIRYSKPYIKIHSVNPDKRGQTEFIIKNLGEVKLSWEKHDPDVSVQTVENEFARAWNSQIYQGD